MGRAAPGFPRDPLEDLIDKARAEGWAVVLEAEQYAVLAEPDTEMVELHDQGGVIIGRIWERSEAAPRQQQLGPQVSAEMRRTQGRSLLTAFWGAYVALIASTDGASLDVLRDPSGAAPCYRISARGLIVIVSDLEIAAALGILHNHIDWGFIGQHVAYGGLRVARTGLKNLAEVLPGTALTLGTLDPAPRLVWDPGEFTKTSRQILDPRLAAQRVQAETRRCVSRLAEAYGPIVLELSGGLDSSILCACLAARPSTFLVNCATRRPEGDERQYARAAALAADLPLTEIALDHTAIDLLQPSTPWMARPGRASALEAIDQAFLDFGRSKDAQAFFSGGGGDNVFCYLKSAAPVVDRLRTEGPTLGLLQTVADISHLHGATVWSVAGQALKLAMRLGGATRTKPRVSLLNQDHLPEGPEPHPWLQGSGVALPGRYRHVHSIAWILGLLDGHARSRFAPMVFPLLAQPLLELCLRIPTWFWVRGGVDRAIARQAFAGHVPPAILTRRNKGRIDREIAAAYDAQRPALADHLLGGLLVQHRVIDPVAVEKALRQPWDSRQGSFSTIMTLADAETWARTWSAGLPSRA